jgi:hypothetical protein
MFRSHRHVLWSTVEQIEVAEFDANALTWLPEKLVGTIETLGIGAWIGRRQQGARATLRFVYGERARRLFYGRTHRELG